MHNSCFEGMSIVRATQDGRTYLLRVFLNLCAHSEDPQSVIDLSLFQISNPCMCNPWCAGHQLKVKVAWMGMWA